MEHCDHPALFQAADKGAINAQKCYITLIRLEFLVLVLAAISSNVQAVEPAWRQAFATATAVLLFVALFSRVIVALAGFEKKWFSCRAIAESVKSLAWRYITRTKPYTGAALSNEIDNEFLEDLMEIRDSRLEGAKKLARQSISGNDITQKMRTLRSMSFGERKSLYNVERVADQKNWYSGKAKMNETMRTFWFWISLVLESIAVIIAFLLIQAPTPTIMPVGVLTTLTAVIIAWTQIKKHSELSQSYCLVVQELGQITSRFIHIDTEEKLSDYVEATENVISKEHTLWLAKREN